MTSYSVTQITLRMCKIELTRVNRYSSGEVDPELFSILVETSLESGSPAGWGEWIPTSIIYEPGHIGRSAIDEWEVARKTASRLIGHDARALRGWIDDDLQKEDANSLVDGFDFSLHDAVGRAMGWSVQHLLGGGRPWVWGMPVIHLDEPDAMAQHCAEHFAEGGYRWFKLKPSCQLERDRETLLKIRERVPAEIRFYIDPNYCLPDCIDTVVDYLNGLHEAGLEVCEDPIPPDLGRYRMIQDRTPVKLMMDEKARTFAQVLAAGEARCARMINIHANWAGGLRRGLRRAELAAAFGMESIIGSVRYLGFGTAAYQTLSSILPSPTPCEQVNDDSYVRQKGVKNPYKTEDGKIRISTEPGLGVEPDRASLEELTLKKIVIK